MAFDRQAALNEGYTPQEIDQYLKQQNQPQAQPTQSSNGGFNLLSFLFPQNYNAIVNGPNQLMQQQAAQPNGKGNLIQSIKNAGNDTLGLAKATVLNPKLYAEDASTVMPLNAGGWLVRLLLGATQGTLQGASQQGATPASIGTNAATSGVTNTLMPPILKNIATEYGNRVLGAGGDQFQNIVKTSGQPIIATGKTLLNKVNQAMEPIKSQFDTLLQDSKNGIPISAVFGKTDPNTGMRLSPGIIHQPIANLGSQFTPLADQYTKNMRSSFDNIYQNYLIDKGLNPQQAIALTSHDENVAPLPVWQSFLKDVGDNMRTAGSWDKKSSPEYQIGSKIYGSLRNLIANTSDNPEQYNNLAAMKQGEAKMIGNQIGQRDLSGKNPSSIARTVGKLIQAVGVPIGGLAALGLGHPAIATTALVGDALSSTPVASTILSSPYIKPSVPNIVPAIGGKSTPFTLGDLLSKLGIRGMGNAAGSTFTNYQ